MDKLPALDGVLLNYVSRMVTSRGWLSPAGRNWAEISSPVALVPNWSEVRAVRVETWEIKEDLLGKVSNLSWGGVEWLRSSSGVRLNSTC